MIKDIAEDIILIALVLVAVYLGWTYWLKDKFFSGAAVVAAKAAEVKEGSKTIYEAVKSPWATAQDLFRSTTPYISPEQYRANIDKIKRNLAGKQ